MELEPPRRRAPAEPFVPMINVVFLLLIFFLMTAQIAPPFPFETTPPMAEAGDEPRVDTILHLSPKGEFGFAESRGEAAIAEASSLADGGKLQLRADAEMAAEDLAKALRRLTEAGIEQVELTTAIRPSTP